jgi:transposase-like protein
VVWGLDLVRPFKKAPGGHTHLLVVIDKFTKWIQVWLIAKIRSEEAIKFFTDIIHRFGVPNSIITDNSTQFTGSWEAKASMAALALTLTMLRQ